MAETSPSVSQGDGFGHVRAYHRPQGDTAEILIYARAESQKPLKPSLPSERHICPAMPGPNPLKPSLPPERHIAPGPPAKSIATIFRTLDSRTIPLVLLSSVIASDNQLVRLVVCGRGFTDRADVTGQASFDGQARRTRLDACWPIAVRPHWSRPDGNVDTRPRSPVGRFRPMHAVARHPRRP